MNNMYLEQRSVLFMLVMTFLTCGIYYIYWIYIFSKTLKFYLNDESISPGMETFFSVICFVYIPFWHYKTAKLVNTAQKKAGIHAKDEGFLHILLSIFFMSLLSALILQNHFNDIVKNRKFIS